MARTINGSATRTATTEPLVAQIASSLMAEIIEGKFEPGERIREQELADRFGTSRGPVREAIRLVEIEGLVETEHFRGARVVDLTIDEVEDLFEVVGALFGVVARLAVRHGSEEDFARFDQAVAKMQAVWEAGAPAAVQIEASYRAAGVLRQCCGSARAGEFLQKAARLVFLQHRFLGLTDRAWRRRALGRWSKLQAAVHARNGDAAEAAARAITRQTETFTLGKLREIEALSRGRVRLGPSHAPARRR